MLNLSVCAVLLDLVKPVTNELAPQLLMLAPSATLVPISAVYIVSSEFLGYFGRVNCRLGTLTGLGQCPTEGRVSLAIQLRGAGALLPQHLCVQICLFCASGFLSRLRLDLGRECFVPESLRTALLATGAVCAEWPH